MKRNLFIVIIVFLIAGAFFVYQNLEPYQKQRLSKTTKKPQPKNTTQKTHIVKISPSFTTKIIEFSKDKGDCFSKGDILARIDTIYLEKDIKDLDLQILIQQDMIKKIDKGLSKKEISRIKARLVLAKAKLQEAKTIYDRQQALFKKNATTKQRLIRTKTAYDGAVAILDDAKSIYSLVNKPASKDDIQVRLSRVKRLMEKRKKLILDLQNDKIIASFDGIILSRLVDVGVLIDPNNIIFEAEKTQNCK